MKEKPYTPEDIQDASFEECCVICVYANMGMVALRQLDQQYQYQPNEDFK